MVDDMIDKVKSKSNIMYILKSRYLTSKVHRNLSIFTILMGLRF